MNEKKNLNQEERNKITKKLYEPPKAIIISVKMEERLMACTKFGYGCTYGWTG